MRFTQATETADCFTIPGLAGRFCEPAMGQAGTRAGNMVVVQGTEGILNRNASRAVDPACT